MNPASSTALSTLCSRYTVPDDPLEGTPGDLENLLWVVPLEGVNYKHFKDGLKGRVEPLTLPKSAPTSSPLFVHSYGEKRAFALWPGGQLLRWQIGYEDDALFMEFDCMREFGFLDAILPDKSPLCLLIEQDQCCKLAVMLNCDGYLKHDEPLTPLKRVGERQYQLTPKSRLFPTKCQSMPMANKRIIGRPAEEENSPAIEFSLSFTPNRTIQKQADSPLSKNNVRRSLNFDEPESAGGDTAPGTTGFLYGVAACTLLFSFALYKGWIRISFAH